VRDAGNVEIPARNGDPGIDHARMVRPLRAAVHLLNLPIADTIGPTPELLCDVHGSSFC
jgi:hypothetical protein